VPACGGTRIHRHTAPRQPKPEKMPSASTPPDTLAYTATQAAEPAELPDYDCH
jgi:hypothetical protein